MSTTYDLNTIQCSIDVSTYDSSNIMSRVNIHNILAKEIEEYFDKYKLQYNIKPLGGIGGGGGIGPTIFEIITKNLQNHDYLGLLLSFYNGFQLIINFLQKKLQESINKRKTPVTIGLSYVVDDASYKSISSDLANIIRGKLINLTHISDEISGLLKAKYPLFNYDKIFAITIIPLNYLHRYELDANKQGIFNNYRLQALIDKLPIQQNYYCIYTFLSKWRFIKKEEGKLTIKNMSQSRELKEEIYIFPF